MKCLIHEAALTDCLSAHTMYILIIFFYKNKNTHFISMLSTRPTILVDYLPHIPFLFAIIICMGV